MSTDTLSKLAQDIRGTAWMFGSNEGFADRLDALAAQQVPDSAWRQAIAEYVSYEQTVNAIERRAAEIKEGK